MLYLCLWPPEFWSRFSGLASLFHMMVLTGSRPGPKVRFSRLRPQSSALVHNTLDSRSENKAQIVTWSLSPQTQILGFFRSVPPFSPLQQNVGKVVLKSALRILRGASPSHRTAVTPSRCASGFLEPKQCCDWGGGGGDDDKVIMMNPAVPLSMMTPMTTAVW